MAEFWRGTTVGSRAMEPHCPPWKPSSLGSSNGYYTHELADVLHAEVQEPLRHLLQQGRLRGSEVDGQFVYTAIDSTDRRNQTLARHRLNKSLGPLPDSRFIGTPVPGY